MRGSIEITSRDYWVKVVEMLQQNWALVDEDDSGCTVYFITDASGVFDRISFANRLEGEQALARNGFKRLANDDELSSFLVPPMPPFNTAQHPSGAIYSSGRYWKA